MEQGYGTGSILWNRVDSMERATIRATIPCMSTEREAVLESIVELAVGAVYSEIAGNLLTSNERRLAFVRVTQRLLTSLAMEVQTEAVREWLGITPTPPRPLSSGEGVEARPLPPWHRRVRVYPHGSPEQATAADVLYADQEVMAVRFAELPPFALCRFPERVGPVLQCLKRLKRYLDSTGKGVGPWIDSGGGHYEVECVTEEKLEPNTKPTDQSAGDPA